MCILNIIYLLYRLHTKVGTDQTRLASDYCVKFAIIGARDTDASPAAWLSRCHGVTSVNFGL